MGKVLSMTGFGRGEATEGAVKITVELSTVNRKQFDCNVALPRECASLESKFQALVHTKVSRGYVKGLVTAEAAADTAGAAALLDLPTLKEQADAIRAAARELDMSDTLTASDLLRFPDVLKPRPLTDDPERLWPAIERATNQALDSLTQMREREGGALTKDLRARFAALHAIRDQIAALAPSVPRYYQAQLEKRLAELLAPGAAVDPALVAREVAVFADHCDISEELTRLSSHFAQADKILSEGGACGRTLDFLCQEFNREINTSGSKANDAEIARLVIAFKAGLEAIREQVQNIE
jgi:uncharacterized protein (TIGR00255 family)